MANDLKNAADRFMSTPEGKKLAGKKGQLEKLASSRDGQAVKSILRGRNIEEAVKKGDTEAIKSALSEILKTDAGARLASQLQELMKQD